MAGEDLAFVRWVRLQRCLVCGKAPVHAHHAGERGLGQRAHDNTCIPLCPKHHDDWHNGAGVFRDRTDRRIWTARQILETQRRYAAENVRQLW